MVTTGRPAVGAVASPPLLYAGALALGLLLNRVRPVAVLPRTAARPVGLALVGLSLLVGLASVVAFRRAGTSPNPYRPTTALVTSGPYRYTRNPIYLSMAGIYAGVAALANALWPFLLLPFALLAIDLGMVAREERYLARYFGEEYRRYLARVPRWL